MAIANLPSNVPSIMVKEMLDRAPAFRRIGVAFDNIKIGKNTGASIIRTRWINGAISVTPEPQGQNPTTQALTAESYTATMQRYSAAYATSRYNDDLNPLDWAKGQSDVLMTEVESTRERLQYNAALSGTNVIYNSAAIATRQTVNGVITLGRLQTAIASIEAAKGMTFTSESGGSTKIGTTPTEAGYYCFVHTNAHPDIRNLPGFTKKAQMTGGNYPVGTFGCVDNIVFVTSPSSSRSWVRQPASRMRPCAPQAASRTFTRMSCVPRARCLAFRLAAPARRATATWTCTCWTRRTSRTSPIPASWFRRLGMTARCWCPTTGWFASNAA